MLLSPLPQFLDTPLFDLLVQYFHGNYKARRAQRQYIGSAHTEKANDLLVARRQKHQGMHWREKLPAMD